jgi:hypothetical protein
MWTVPRYLGISRTEAVLRRHAAPRSHIQQVLTCGLIKYESRLGLQSGGSGSGLPLICALMRRPNGGRRDRVEFNRLADCFTLRLMRPLRDANSSFRP